MSTILESQIDCYENSLGTVVARQGNVSRQQLEEAITVGVGLFRTVVTEVHAFNSKSEAIPHEQMLDEARVYHRRYERVSAQLDRLHDIVSAYHSTGVPVRGVEKLDEARFELSTILNISLEDLEESYQDVLAGRTVSLAQVRDELRRRVHT